MSSIEQRLEYLEEANDVLRMQNHVLATALKGLIRSLPSDMANEAVESIQLAFEAVSYTHLTLPTTPYV